MAKPSIIRLSRLPLLEKIDVINEVNNYDLDFVAKRHKVTRQAVEKIVLNSDVYMEAASNSANLKCRRVIERDMLKPVEEELVKFIGLCNDKRVPITYEIMQQKALSIAEEKNIIGFTASLGWINKFLKRNNVGKKKICGESAAVDRQIVSDWHNVIETLVTNTGDTVIINADETCFFYRATSTVSYFLPGKDPHGGRVSKERFTVMFAVTSDGVKLKPLVIGKAEKPRCFSNTDKEELNCYYNNSANGWMTASIFSQWLKEIDDAATAKRKKILLVLDNFSGHQILTKLNNTIIIFLPANTTSLTQPLDLGIISAVKRRYKTLLNKSLIENIENMENSETYLKSLNLKHGIQNLIKAYKQISSETIINCFEAAHIKHNICSSIADFEF